MAGIALHELMMSYVRAGFSRKEALDLVKTSLVEATRQNAAPTDG